MNPNGARSAESTATRAYSLAAMPPQVFGKYTLIGRLGHGGMAEVNLAVSEGKGGFRKLVVIKKLHRHLAMEPGFIEMFLDEARLAARLNHPHAVQTYEVGESDEDYFASKVELREGIEGDLVASGGRVDAAVFGAQVPDSLTFATANGRTVFGGGLEPVGEVLIVEALVEFYPGVSAPFEHAVEAEVARHRTAARALVAEIPAVGLRLGGHLAKPVDLRLGGHQRGEPHPRRPRMHQAAGRDPGRRRDPRRRPRARPLPEAEQHVRPRRQVQRQRDGDEERERLGRDPLVAFQPRDLAGKAVKAARQGGLLHVGMVGGEEGLDGRFDDGGAGHPFPVC